MKTRICKTAMVMILAVLILSLPAVGRAEFPERPITVLVAWAAGSWNDMVDRAIAQVLQKILKQPVIVQDMPGAGGTLVPGRVKMVKPDGYTLFQTGFPMYSHSPHLRAVPYDPFKDFAYLAMHGWIQYFIKVLADSPWKTYEELIAYVKKNPGKVRYATGGIGTTDHLIMEYLAMRENLQWIHIPFAGSNECLAALLGGHVELISGVVALDLEQVRTGKLRILLSLNPTRSPLFPEVPSILEKGYDFAVRSGPCWTVPSGTPKDIQRKLESALLQSFKDPMVIDVLNKWNLIPDVIDGQTLAKMVAEDYKIKGELLKQFGMGIYKKD